METLGGRSPISRLGQKRTLVITGVILAVVIVYGARWYITPTRTYPDTYQYLALSFDLAGQSQDEARLSAAQEYCRDFESSPDYSSCINNWLAIPERFFDIFAYRYGYPLASAPFVGLIGARGLTLGSALLGVLWSLAFIRAIQLSGGTLFSALGAVVIVYLLPSGHWATTKLAEGATYLGISILLVGSLLVMKGSTGVGLTAVIASIAWLGVTKASSAIAVAAGIAFAALLVALFSKDRAMRHRGLGLAGATAGSGGVLLGAMHLLGAPGLNETLQDMYTGHFRSPDIEDPLGRLLSELPVVVTYYVGVFRDNALGIIALAAALAGIYWMARRAGVNAASTTLLWAAVGLSGVPLVLVHPVLSEVPRLMAVVWLPIAVGFAAVITGSIYPPPSSRGPRSVPGVPEHPQLPPLLAIGKS